MTSLPPSFLICIPFSFLFVFLFFLCLVALPPKPQDSAECKRFAWTSLLCSVFEEKPFAFHPRVWWQWLSGRGQLFHPHPPWDFHRTGVESFQMTSAPALFSIYVVNDVGWYLHVEPVVFLESTSFSVNQSKRTRFFFFLFLRALRGSLFSAYHSVLQKNKKKAAQLFPQLVALTCPWDQGMQQKKPIPRVYTRHSDVNHEN